MNKFIQILWKLFLFSFPFSLHFVLYEQATYRFGNFNPWVTGFVYLPEILLFSIFLLRLIQLRVTIYPLIASARSAKQENIEVKLQNYELRDKSPQPSFLSLTRKSLLILFILFLLNAGVVTFLKGDPQLFGFFLLHVLAGCLVYHFIKQEVIAPEKTIQWLLYGALFQVILAFLQVKLNHSVGLSMLGEPNISPEILNVAKNNLENGTKAIRGYGTFLHPNIFGVYLMTILFVSLPYLKKLALIFWPAVLLIGIYLTGSQAALLATVGLFVLLVLFKLFKNPSYRKGMVFGGLAVFFAANVWFFLNSNQVHVDDSSLAERIEQNVISIDMFKDNLSGVGVQNFTLEMENYSENKLKPWAFQPVHNVYFLVLNEMGIQGLILLLITLILLLNPTLSRDQMNSPTKALPLLGLIFVASFDHLLMTSYIGPLMIGLVLSQLKLKV